MIDASRQDEPLRQAAWETCEVRLLGAFDVRWRGVRLDTNTLRRAKVRHLVQLLALQPDHKMTRDRVLEALWPHLEPSAAANQLYNTVYRLRAAAHEAAMPGAKDTIETAGGIVALAPAATVVTDVEVFRAAAARAVRTQDPRHLDEAIRSYGGPLLPDDAYESWTMEDRARLEETYTLLLTSLATLRAASADWRGTIEILSRVVSLDPLHEEAHRGLLHAYARLGERAQVEAHYRSCEQMFQRELGVPPSPETRRLYQDLTASKTARSAFAASSASSPFVGRQYELSEIARSLSTRRCRLLTLTGLGGIGKTRLAEAAMERLRPLMPDGVHAVQVPAHASVHALSETIAEALGGQAAGGESGSRKLVRLLAEQDMMLVLDGAEQAPELATLVQHLLENVERLVVLVTSRHRLGLQGEWVMEVRGLDVPRPEATDDLLRFGSSQLFVQAARKVLRDFTPTGEDEAAIKQICRLLDGVPLALELAAGWVRVLSCREIAQELEHSLELLATRAPDVPERHRSLRATFQHSWSLLTEAERSSFAQASVFHSRFPRRAAESVAGLTLDLLSRAIEKSLIRQAADGIYEIHPVLRQFAAEKLSASGDEAATRQRFASHVLGWLAGRDARSLRHQDVWRDVLLESENLRAAWAIAAEQGAMDLLDAALENLHAVFDVRGWHEDGAALCRLAADAFAPPSPAAPFRGRVLARLGAFERRLGRWSDARSALAEGVAILEAAACPKCAADLATALDTWGVVEHETGDDARARELLDRSLAVRKGAEDAAGISTSLNNLGSLAFALGDMDEAEEMFRRSLAITGAARGLGTAVALQNLASIAFAGGDSRRAEELVRDALAALPDDGPPTMIVLLRSHLAQAALARAADRDALEQVQSALRTAIEVQADGLAAMALPALASWLERKQAPAQALLVAAVVRRHANAPDVAQRAVQPIYDRLTRRLPPSMVHAVTLAARHVRPLDLAELGHALHLDGEAIPAAAAWGVRADPAKADAARSIPRERSG